MNKKDLVTAIAEKANITFSQAEMALAATFDTIQTVMMEQDNVVIAGFGSFSSKIREERKGRNPGTGKEIIIPKAIVPVFKAGTKLKESVNSSKTGE